MYSGHMLDELVQMVARAEEHARDTSVAEPEVQAPAIYVSPFLYESRNQHAFVGVA